MNIKFQPYQASDKDYIWQTYVTAMKHHIENIWGWDESWQQTDFEKNLQKYQIDLIQIESQPIGYVQFSKNTDKTYINMLILELSYQNQGIGVKVLESIQKSNHDLPLELKCFKANQAAYQFYINNEFDVIESDDSFISLRRKSTMKKDNAPRPSVSARKK